MCFTFTNDHGKSPQLHDPIRTCQAPMMHDKSPLPRLRPTQGTNEANVSLSHVAEKSATSRSNTTNPQTGPQNTNIPPSLPQHLPHLTTFLHYFPTSPAVAVASPPPSSHRTSPPRQHCRPHYHRLQTHTPRTARTACDRKSGGARAAARRRRTGRRR